METPKRYELDGTTSIKATPAEYYDFLGFSIKEKMTEEIALKCKELRVDKGYTWRAVCRDMAVLYPQLNLTIHPDGGGFQIDGSILCEVCREYLKEDIVKDGWN